MLKSRELFLFLSLRLLFTASVVSELPEDSLKEGWQLKFMVDDRCVALCFSVYRLILPFCINLNLLSYNYFSTTFLDSCTRKCSVANCRDGEAEAQVAWWRSGMALDLRSRGRGFDSRSGRYQVVTTWMGDSADKQATSVYNQPPTSTQPSIPLRLRT